MRLPALYTYEARHTAQSPPHALVRPCHKAPLFVRPLYIGIEHGAFAPRDLAPRDAAQSALDRERGKSCLAACCCHLVVRSARVTAASDAARPHQQNGQ